MPKNKALVPCYKCNGTGTLDSDLNDLAALVDSLADAEVNEVDEIIAGAIQHCQVRKSRQPHAEKLIRTAFESLLRQKGP